MAKKYNQQIVDYRNAINATMYYSGFKVPYNILDAMAFVCIEIEKQGIHPLRIIDFMQVILREWRQMPRR